MQIIKIHKFICELICYVLFSILFISCNAKHTQIDISSIAALNTTSGSPCIHEQCFERPRWISCIEYGPSACKKWEIIYEHHCGCDAWGPIQRDAGQE